MDKFQLRLTPEEADFLADALKAASPHAENAQEVHELARLAARLNHLAASARARSARAAAG